jgi:hypothetical protein
MRHGLALGVLALFDAAGPLQRGRSDRANVPANEFHEPHEVMTSRRTVEIANGQ